MNIMIFLLYVFLEAKFLYILCWKSAVDVLEYFMYNVSLLNSYSYTVEVQLRKPPYSRMLYLANSRCPKKSLYSSLNCCWCAGFSGDALHLVETFAKWSIRDA